MLKDRETNKKNNLIIIFLILILSVGAIYLFRNKAGSEIRSSKVIEFTATGSLSLNEMQGYADKIDKGSELQVLEDNMYRIYYPKNVSDDKAKEQINSITSSGSTVDISSVAPVFNYQLASRSIILLVIILVSLLIFIVVYKNDLKKYERFSIGVNIVITLVFEAIVLNGVSFLFAGFNLYQFNFWTINLIVALLFLGMIIEITKYTKFSYIFEKLEGKECLDKYSFFAETNIPRFLQVISILLLMFASPYILMKSPHVYATLIIISFGLILTFCFYFFDPLMLGIVYNKISNMGYFKKTRFWQRQ